MTNLKAKKISVYKGYIIAQRGEEFEVYTKDEWTMGEGFRYPEFEVCGTIEEAKQNID